MANVAHLVRRQSSRDLNPQRSLDRLELKEVKNRLRLENGNYSSFKSKNPGGGGGGVAAAAAKTLTATATYGSTANASFEVAVDKAESASVIMKSSSSSTGFLDAKSSETKPIFHAEGGGAEEDRESWDSKLTFLLATVGYAVGLGNVWRFPYLAQKNGGGAFLIPYFIMLAIEGIPIFYLELAIGQRLRKGAIGVWSEVSPYLVGIGISSAVVSFNVALYYNTIIAWCLFYFVQSFQTELPWATCPNKSFPNGSYVPEPECMRSTPTQYFWYRTTLLISKDINTPEVFNWKIAITLMVAWILVYLCMIKGIASSGKVVYVTATFPYIVLVIFFFRGITLKGMSDGLQHLFTPKWYMLMDPVVWLEAGTQIFFSLGLAFGGLIAFSSYNPVNNNCFRDAITVSFTNCFTSMFAGIVVFSIIGFKARMAYEDCLEERHKITMLATLNSPQMKYLNFSSVTEEGHGPVFLHHNYSHYMEISLPECNLQKELDNTASGTGLAFIIFTEAINQFPGAQFWAVLFFLMLFTLGIDSQFGTLEGVVTSIVDMKLFPNLRKEILTGILCTFCCAISMCFANGAGNYIFTLFDNFSGNFPLLIIAFCECVAVSYVYGVKRFSDDIELMIGTRPSLYWQICWKYLSPLAMILILTASVLEIVLKGSGYPAWLPEKGETRTEEWPTWAILLIIFLISISILWIPGIAILRAMGITIVEEKEKAWFPAEELKEYYGIENHEVSAGESMLFCIGADGSEGLCFPTHTQAQYQGVVNEFEDDEL